MSLRAAMRRALLLCAALLLGGCAVQTEALRRTLPADLVPRVELAATPFIPQTDYHCGPAALATVLAGVGRPVSPDLLGEQIFLRRAPAPCSSR